MAEKAYRVPLIGHEAGIMEFVIEPSPFSDPNTVRCTLFGGPSWAWVILPRDLFSDAVNERTTK